MRVAPWLVILAACGRVGFTELDPTAGDAAPGDGNGDGATPDASPDCSPGFDICDGFEDGLNGALWTKTDSVVALDTTFGHRGSSSIRVRSPASAANTNNYHSLYETQTIAGGATTFWIRGWFYLSSLPATGNGMELITAETPGASGDFVFIRADRTSLYSQYGGGTRNVMATPPVASWFCLVFKVVRSTTTTGSLELSGAVPAINFPGIITDGAPPMSVISFGVGFASGNTLSPQPALDVWIDDVIVHSAAVTCAD